jgi:hypothetical protein
MTYSTIRKSCIIKQKRSDRKHMSNTSTDTSEVDEIIAKSLKEIPTQKLNKLKSIELEWNGRIITSMLMS